MFNQSSTLPRLVQGPKIINQSWTWVSLFLIKNDIKILKRDWKLSNPSYFTYTSIVQPIFISKHPIYTVFGDCFVPMGFYFTCIPYFTGQYPILYSFWELVLSQIQQIRSRKNDTKMARLGPILSRSLPTGYIKPPQWVNGVDGVLFYLYTLFYRSIPHFTQFLGACFVPNTANSKREK